jgi:16S rRNA (guanine527-N7)-methyltransferase
MASYTGHVAKKRPGQAAGGAVAVDPAAAARALVPLVERVAAGLGEPLSAEHAEALASYAVLVRSWNAHVNLTAARDDASLCEVLLADALVLRAPALIPAGTCLLDVGTGAGAPLLPLLVLRPDLRAISVEPLHKRVAFLRTSSARLGLSARVQVREGRIDPSAPSFSGVASPNAPPNTSPSVEPAFELACSRATFAPELWLRLGLALAPAVLVLTVEALPNPLPEGVTLTYARDYALPLSGAPRRAQRYERSG